MRARVPREPGVCRRAVSTPLPLPVLPCVVMANPPPSLSPRAEPPGGEARLRRIVDHVVQQARLHVAPDRIWLFGSHARGTADRGSDMDFALRLRKSDPTAWSRFVLETQDSVPALIDLDLVDIDRCGPELAREIEATGRLVYEAPTAR